MPNYKNILIIKPSALGDIIHSLPVLDIIKKSWPDAKISWFVREEFAPLLDNHPDIDSLIIFKRKLLGKFWYNRTAFNELISLVKIMRQTHFDVVFDLQGLLRTAFFSFITGSKKRFGMAQSRESGWFFYTDRIANNTDSINVSDYYVHLLKQAGAANGETKFFLPVNEQAQLKVDELLKENGLQKDKFILFIPGAAHLYKCWPAENFAKIAEILLQKTSMKIAVAGTRHEMPIIEKLKMLSKVEIKDLSGKTNILQLVALINSAAMVIGNDTGPGHIAAALNKPLVMIFGPTNPRRVGPYGRPQCIAAVDAEKRDDKIESVDPKYKIEAVSVEMVLEKAYEQLRNLKSQI